MEKSTGPPSPASASRRLIMTAIAASSFPSAAVPVPVCSLDSLEPTEDKMSHEFFDWDSVIYSPFSGETTVLLRA